MLFVKYCQHFQLNQVCNNKNVNIPLNYAIDFSVLADICIISFLVPGCANVIFFISRWIFDTEYQKLLLYIFDTYCFHGK